MVKLKAIGVVNRGSSVVASSSALPVLLSPWSMSSSTAATVTVCGTLQVVLVNARLAGANVTLAARAIGGSTATVTSCVGWMASRAVKFAVRPPPAASVTVTGVPDITMPVSSSMIMMGAVASAPMSMAALLTTSRMTSSRRSVDSGSMSPLMRATVSVLLVSPAVKVTFQAPVRPPGEVAVPAV